MEQRQARQVKCVIPDGSYSSVYDAIVKNCQEKGQFGYTTTGQVSNVGLMVKKTDEYGSHDKTFEIAPSLVLTMLVTRFTSTQLRLVTSGGCCQAYRGPCQGLVLAG